MYFWQFSDREFVYYHRYFNLCFLVRRRKMVSVTRIRSASAERRQPKNGSSRRGNQDHQILKVWPP